MDRKQLWLMRGKWWWPLDNGLMAISPPRSQVTWLRCCYPGGVAVDFPIVDLLDEEACYRQLVAWLHPQGLACPDCHQADRLLIHRRDRQPLLDYRCGHCGRVFNAFTATALQGTHHRPAALILILRGIAQGVPTAQLARELH